MEESSEMSVSEVIAELGKPLGESKFDRERLLAHLTFLAWFRNHTGKKARAYFSPHSLAPFILTKDILARWLREGISGQNGVKTSCG